MWSLRWSDGPLFGGGLYSPDSQASTGATGESGVGSAGGKWNSVQEMIAISCTLFFVTNCEKVTGRKCSRHAALKPHASAWGIRAPGLRVRYQSSRR